MNATPTRPTPEQLQRVIDVVAAGLELEDAIESVWADVPEPKPQPKPNVMVTEFPDGVVIGWDFCAAANQGCGKHVSKCACKGGPKEAKVFAKWRADADTMPNYGKAAQEAKAAGVATTDVGGKGNVGVVVAVQSDLGRAGNEPADLSKSQVRCVLSNHTVAVEDADQNDDGTYSCFDCQEKGLQRGVTS